MDFGVLHGATSIGASGAQCRVPSGGRGALVGCVLGSSSPSA
jgi:hypothetical protein